MASSTSSEILDLRHFSALMLRQCWRRREISEAAASLGLSVFCAALDAIPGQPHVAGYAAVADGARDWLRLCVYEETKAVNRGGFSRFPASQTRMQFERWLLRHLLELLVNSPQVDRIESQLLASVCTHSAGSARLDLNFFGVCSWSSRCVTSGARRR